MDEHDRAEAEDIIRAIRHGEVDAFVVREAAEERIYSLRSADLLYRAMIEEMKDGAVALDASGLIVYCNAYFAQLVRAERAAIVGSRISSWAPTAGAFSELTEEATRTGASRRELALRASDGTLVPVLAVMNRIQLDENDVYCLIVTDLTEQRRQDQLLIEGRRKDEFLAMLAHELRNPIAPIRYAAERLRAGNTTPGRLQWARDVINRQVDQLTHLVDDLLDVSRITRGKINLNERDLDIDEVVGPAIESVRPLIEGRKQDLKVTRPAQRLRVHGDGTRLAQVVSNLLQNAAKFTPEGGEIRLRIEAETEAKGDDKRAWVRIVVTDNGIGMEPSLLAEMFDLFAQGDTTQGRSQGGLGIGLTLVRSFVELHGGTVQGASAGAGQGSTFVVRLPLLPEAPAADAGEAARGQAPTRAAGEGAAPFRLLIVDDNDDVAESLSEWLGDMGHEVRVAKTAAAALEEARAFRPRVMFIDIGLPDMSGHEIARRLRGMPDVGDAILIALTGYGQAKDRRLSEEAGFDQHWTKPLSGEMLEDLLASLDAADSH